MSTPSRHPKVESVLAIHKAVLAAHGGSQGLRSQPLLESAVAAPQASMMGQLVISDPIEIAAAYLFYLCSNHPFVDGNKRVGLATCLVFLAENGLLPNEALACDPWEALIISLAAGELDRESLTQRLRQLLA